MGACAAVPTTCVAPCGAIRCTLRQRVHNKDDHNKDHHNEDDHNKDGHIKNDYCEDDHTVFPFQFSATGRGTQGRDSVSKGGMMR